MENISTPMEETDDEEEELALRDAEYRLHDLMERVDRYSSLYDFDFEGGVKRKVSLK